MWEGVDTRCSRVPGCSLASRRLAKRSGLTSASHSSRVQSAKWLRATSWGAGAAGAAALESALALAAALAAPARCAARRAVQPATKAALRSNSARRAWYSLSWEWRRPDLGTGDGGAGWQARWDAVLRSLQRVGPVHVGLEAPRLLPTPQQRANTPHELVQP